MIVTMALVLFGCAAGLTCCCLTCFHCRPDMFCYTGLTRGVTEALCGMRLFWSRATHPADGGPATSHPQTYADEHPAPAQVVMWIRAARWVC
jgi:hypothetical protein